MVGAAPWTARPKAPWGLTPVTNRRPAFRLRFAAACACLYQSTRGDEVAMFDHEGFLVWHGWVVLSGVPLCERVGNVFEAAVVGGDGAAVA